MEIGPGADQRHYGIFQVNVFVKAGEWEKVANAAVREVLDGFPVGDTLENSGVLIRITNAYREKANQEPDWLHIPVIIEWRADF